MKVLIVGCGYVGLALATEVLRGGHKVWGVRRTRAGCAELERCGITPVLADVTDPGTFRALPAGCDWVVTGSAVFHSADAEATVREMREIASNSTAIRV